MHSPDRCSFTGQVHCHEDYNGGGKTPARGEWRGSLIWVCRNDRRYTSLYLWACFLRRFEWWNQRVPHKESDICFSISANLACLEMICASTRQITESCLLSYDRNFLLLSQWARWTHPRGLAGPLQNGGYAGFCLCWRSHCYCTISVQSCDTQTKVLRDVWSLLKYFGKHMIGSSLVAKPGQIFREPTPLQLCWVFFF